MYSSSESYEPTIPLCKSKVMKINPNDLIRERGYEVNENPQIQQSIEVEVCENEGSPCNFVTQVKTACRQRYMGIKLKVFSKDGKKSSLEDFTIPSICECAFFTKNTRDLPF